MSNEVILRNILIGMIETEDNIRSVTIQYLDEHYYFNACYDDCKLYVEMENGREWDVIQYDGKSINSQSDFIDEIISFLSEI